MRGRVGGVLLATALAATTPAAAAEPDSSTEVAALAAAVGSLSLTLGHGHPLEAGAPIAAANLPAPALTRLTVLTRTLATCHAASASARAALDRFGVRPTGTTAVEAFRVASGPPRACAARLESLALETAHWLRSHAGGGALDLWPVLRYAPDRTDDIVVDDYALSVDAGGADAYPNNAGANLLDLVHRPARGCHKVALEFPDSCQVAVALLVDADGDDVYGKREAPDPADDGFCTADPVVRRMSTIGSGFAGVGVLVDSAGNDRYLAKTNAQGSGHLAGVGILHDEAGDDSYLAIRNSQGYGLVGGLGILRDDAGSDRYDYFTPGPLNRNAAYQRPGSGGVIDDTGTCDTLPRMMQGSANVPGSLGMLIDLGGDDYYRGSPAAPQLFDPSLPEPAQTLHHGSQGFGGDGGSGYFLDRGGRDRYVGVAGHRDDTTIEPAPPDNLGRFVDEQS